MGIRGIRCDWDNEGMGKAGKVTVTYADGTVEVVKPGAFRKPTKRQRWYDKRHADYNRYIDSPEWKAKRKHALDRDHHRCTACGSSKRLEVHHLTYRNFTNEPLHDLATLCLGCHEKHHEAERAAKRAKKAA